MLILLAFMLTLEYRWQRAIHIVSGFMWWGMVFFLVWILLPIFSSFTKATQYEVLGTVFPRIFKTATVVGFFTVSLGWYIALDEFAQWNLSYFTTPLINVLFLIGLLLVTGLYMFHLFLENNEIETVVLALSTESDEKIDKLISNLRRIPYIGFTIMTSAVILMFVH